MRYYFRHYGRNGPRLETGAWVAENIPAGRVRDSKLSFAADLGAAKGVRKLYDVEGDIKLRNAELIWAKGATAITNIDADLYWNNDAFHRQLSDRTY